MWVWAILLLEVCAYTSTLSLLGYGLATMVVSALLGSMCGLDLFVLAVLIAHLTAALVLFLIFLHTSDNPGSAGIGGRDRVVAYICASTLIAANWGVLAEPWQPSLVVVDSCGLSSSLVSLVHFFVTRGFTREVVAANIMLVVGLLAALALALPSASAASARVPAWANHRRSWRRLSTSSVRPRMVQKGTMLSVRDKSGYAGLRVFHTYGLAWYGSV